MSSAAAARSRRGHLSTKLTASSEGWAAPSILAQGVALGSALHVGQGRTRAWVLSGAGATAGTRSHPGRQ